MTGTVYMEAVVHAAPEAFVSDVPYQTAIVSLEEGGRVTGRMGPQAGQRQFPTHSLGWAENLRILGEAA
jgi:uncharacterized OB-fold protein